MARNRKSIFVAATGDVVRERKIAQFAIARLRQEYSDRYEIIDGEWDFDFQDCSMDPATADVAIFIFGSRLPSPDDRHELRNLAGSKIVSDIQWQFEKTVRQLETAKYPDVFVFRKSGLQLATGAEFKRSVLQVQNLREFWKDWFVDEKGHFKAAWQAFDSAERFELAVEPALRRSLDLPLGGTDKIAFVSHASDDAQKVQKILETMEGAGIKCWIAPRDIPAGKNYQDEIVKAFENAKAMVLIFSAAANKSDEIKKELSLASSLGLLVVPVRIDDSEPQRGFRYELANRQWIDVFGDRFSDIDRVIAALKEHFSRY
jgi:TIR domain-containing protein